MNATEFETELPEIEFDPDPDGWADIAPRALKAPLDQLVAAYLANGGTITEVPRSEYRKDNTLAGDKMIRQMNKRSTEFNEQRSAARREAEPERVESMKRAIAEGNVGICNIASICGIPYTMARYLAHKYNIEIPTHASRPLRNAEKTCAGKSNAQRAEVGTTA